MALTAAQLAQLQQQLQARRTQLLGAIRQGVADAESDRPRGEVYDRGDEAVTDLQRDTDYALSEIDQRELDDIQAALARISDGSYGQCSECGVEIGLARLQSQPAAARCINCQGEAERRSGQETHRL